MAKRLAFIDSAKAAMLLFIVFGNALLGGEVYHYLISFHVPAFFFLSGLVFRVTESSRFFGFAIKKARKILVPYFSFGILFVVVYFIAGLVSFAEAKTPVFENLLQLLNGCGLDGRLKFNLSLWFLPCIFVVYMITYGLERLVQKIYGEKKYIGYLLLIVIFASVAYLGSCANIIHTTDHTVLSLFRAIPLTYGLGTAVNMVPFFLLGMLLQSLNLTELNFKKSFLAIAAFVGIVGGGVAAFFNGDIQCVNNIYDNYLLFLLSAALSSVGFVSLFALCPQTRLLSYIGKRTIIILCLHSPILYVFQKFVPVVNQWLASPSSVLGIASAVVVSAVAVALCLLVEPLNKRYLPFMLGGWYSKNEKQS